MADKLIPYFGKNAHYRGGRLVLQGVQSGDKVTIVDDVLDRGETLGTLNHYSPLKLAAEEAGWKQPTVISLSIATIQKLIFGKVCVIIATTIEISRSYGSILP
ncbi:MAG: hypothetical protein ABIL62_04805 [Planctomycetota bacterium]